MISLVSLLVAAALVSQHSGSEANAIDNSKLTLDNNLQPNVITPPKRPRRLKKFVHIWTAPAEEVKRVAGERVVLQCVAMGNPAPSISWDRNGEVVQDFEEEVNEILPPAPPGLAQLVSKLVITSTTPGEDQYTCHAISGAKRESASSMVYTAPSEDDEEDLLALQKLFIPTKPTITYYYNELFQDTGSVVVLPCRAHSYTKVQIYWQDRTERLIYGNPRMKVLPSGELVINGLRWAEDVGNFTCVAKNVFGKDSATTFVYPTKP